MNPLTLVKRIQKINQREASLGMSDDASWHAKYKDSASVFVGSIPFDLTEGDLLAVFAQDKATGKSKGFAFVAYEDRRSTNLAVDNLNGTQILGRITRVDHCSNYKKKDEETVRQKREARGSAVLFRGGNATVVLPASFLMTNKMDKHSSQSARMLESAAGEWHRTTDKNSEVSKGKYESMTRDRHNERASGDTDRRSDREKGTNYEGDGDRSSFDRRSRRHDGEQMSREDLSKRDDMKLRRHESEFHRKEERESTDGGNRQVYDRNSSSHHRRMDDDNAKFSREDRDKRDEKRSRGYRSEAYRKEARESRAGDRRPGYD